MDGLPQTRKTEPTFHFRAADRPGGVELKWLPDEHIVMDMDMHQNMEISIPSQPAPMKQNMTMGQEYGLTVLMENPEADMKWNWNSSASGWIAMEGRR